MHLKRNNISKFWPVPKKGTKYVAVSSHNQNESLPLVVVLRDVLKIIINKKELQRAINEKKISVNGKIVHDTNYPIALFDVINLNEMKKNFKATLSTEKKMTFEEVSNKDAESKIFKVLNKKILGDKKIQLNLMHGINVISKEDVKTGDSVLLNLKEKKILKTIKMEKGKNAFVVKGKHAGKKGKIEDIVERGGKKIAKISEKSNKLNVWTKNIIVIE